MDYWAFRSVSYLKGLHTLFLFKGEMKMKTKTSITKKTLSVFLSVLMLFSCCVTATPWLAETFGLKADAASGAADWQALVTSVNTAISKAGSASNAFKYSVDDRWATNRTVTDNTERGVLFDVIYNLAQCVSKDVVTGSGSTANGSRPGTLLSMTQANIDNYFSDTTVRAGLKELAIYLCEYRGIENTDGDFSYYVNNKLEEKHRFVAWMGTTPSDYAGLGEPDDFTVTVVRSVKAAIYYYDTIDQVNDTVETSFVLSFDIARAQEKKDDTRAGTGYKYAWGWYHYNGVSLGSKSKSDSHISYVKNFLNYFKETVNYTGNNNTTISSERVQADPFGQFADLDSAEIGVGANANAYKALWESGYWTNTTSDQTDVNIVNHFGGQYTTVAGDPCASVGFGNAVDTYMDACYDALNYYNAKYYAQLIGQYSLDSGSKALDRGRLYFYRNPSTNLIEKEFDSSYLTEEEAYNIWKDIRGWLDAIEKIYGTADGNVTDSSVSKGLKKLYSIDSYLHSDVIELLNLLEDYFEHYQLVARKEKIDAFIEEYQIPKEEFVDLSQGTYRFRDNDPNSESYVSDEAIDILYGEIASFYNDLISSVYSERVMYYVFGNENFDSRPDYQYLGVVNGYIEYEVERRGFIAELAPFIIYFSPYINMNVASLTATQLQTRIDEDQGVYERIYDYRFYDDEGNDITPEYWNSHDYNYINVYNKYYNKANSGSFNSNPLARADMLALLGSFNEQLQAYIYSLYEQLATILTNRVLDAMNATNDADENLEITLSNFAAIKAMLESVKTFYTILAEPEYDESGNRTGMYVYDYLDQHSYMYKQSRTDENGYYNDDFVNTKLDLLSKIRITTALGNDYDLKTAYDKVMRSKLMEKYNEFVASGGLKNWKQEHYYNTSDPADDGGYYFTNEGAYMVRPPYAGDLGRGNNSNKDYDTYKVTNKMVDGLVDQLDAFLGSTDLVHILSSFMDDEMQDMKLPEYVMKLLGEKLFTDDIINMLVGMIFPMLTGELENLWNNLSKKKEDGGVNPLATILGIKINLEIKKSIYDLTRELGLLVYPDVLSTKFTGAQLDAARAAFADNSIKGSDVWTRGQDWDRLIEKHHAEDDETALNIDWGVSSYNRGANQSMQNWFENRADRFATALSAVLSGLEPVLLAILADRTYNQPQEYIKDVATVVVTADLKGLKIQGINGYSRVIVPLLEMLGCSSADIVAPEKVSQELNSTRKLLDAILNPIINLVTDQVAVAPLATILTLLPNLLYFLSFNTIDTLLEDLTITISGAQIVAFSIPIVGDVIIGAAGLVKTIGLDQEGLSWHPDCELLSNKNNELYLNIYGLIGGNLNSLIKDIDISDINSIISMAVGSLLGDVEMPVVDVGSVLARTQLKESVPTNGRPYIETKAVKSDGKSTFERHYFESDKADMFYDIIGWIAKAFQNDSFVNQLLAVITKSNEEPDELISDILAGVKRAGPANFVMALVEVFQPKARAGVDKNSVWWNTTYMPAQYKWYGVDDAKNNMAGKPISKFLYVAYQNDWTYAKANTFVENADTIITKLLENQLKEREVNSFGELILSLINLAWSNEAITTVMRLLVSVGNAVNSEILTYILSRFTENGMDFSDWYKAFGYWFQKNIKMDEVETGENDDEGNPITEKKLPEYLDPANKDYVNVFPKLSVKENPDYVEGESGENQLYIWSYNGVEFKDGDRAVFQEILGYILTGGDGKNGGVMPAIDIFLSGDTAILFPQADGSSLLKIFGSNGYDSALVPLFETLGMNEILDEDDFVRFAEEAGLKANQNFVPRRTMLRQEEFNNISDESHKIQYLFNTAFGFLEKLTDADFTMVDGEKVYTLDENGNKVYNNLVGTLLTTVLPSLLYFMQSNGLSVLIRNLLQPILTLVDDLMPAIGLNISNDYTLDTLLNKIVGRFVIDGMLGIERPVDEETGKYIDDYGISLNDLSFHAIANILEKIVPGLNMDPLVYGLDAICSAYTADPFDSASELSVSFKGESFKRYAFLSGSYYQYDDEGNLTICNENDPANVVTIILSMVLDLVLADSKTVGKTNAEVLVDFIGGLLGDAGGILEIVPQIVKTLRELGFSTAYTIDPNWSYFDDLDRGPDDRRTTAQLIAEAEAAGNNMINTPVRTIYYLRYAENFGSQTNLWSRALATYLDNSLSDLADWIIGDFVAKDGSTLGDYVQNLLTGENGFINKGVVNTINAALRDGIGGAVEQFSEILNVFISFNVSYWADDPYPEEEENDALSLEQFGTDVAKLLTPMNEILTWLLSGRDMALFHSYKTSGNYTEWVMDESERAPDYGDIKDLITIPGGQGYWVALVPLLETLGIELPKDETGEYLFKRDNSGRIYYVENGTEVYADGVKILTEVIVTVLSQINGWLEGKDPLGLGDNLIDIVLNRLANLIYFLNANGLVSIVVNLLSPLVPLANSIVPLIFSDLGIPEQGENEDASAYESRKFIALVDGLLAQLIDGIPEGFTIGDLNLYNIFELLKELVGIDINGAVTSTFYVNGEDETDGVVDYNYLISFFLGEIRMRISANGNHYFRMDFNDEESRADFITIILYTAMDVLNSAVTPGTKNNEFFVNILGKATNEDGESYVDKELGQSKLDSIYNILHAKVSGYEGYDWFYFDKDARAYYYANMKEGAYDNYVNYEKVAAIIEAITKDGYYQVDMANTTMEYLLTGYLNYTDSNLWDEGTARQMELAFNEIVNLALESFLGEGVDLGSYVNGLLEDMALYSNKYIVLLGALLGDLLKNIPENVAELVTAAIPGLDLTYWDKYAGLAVEDEKHPAGTVVVDEETGKETTYIPLAVYDSKEQFVSEFTSLFTPLGYLLDWILVGEGKGLELFYVVDGKKNDTPAISIGGANGFKEGLVPLLEALGLEFDKDKVNDENLTGIGAVELTLNSLLKWVDKLLDNPVEGLIDLLPNLIYFINSNGLTVSVLNTLRSVTNILELASDLIGSGSNISDLNSLFGLDSKGIDIYDLSLEGIMNMLYGFTGLDILHAVSLPELDEEGNVKKDEEGNVIYQPSYLQQWAIGKVVANKNSALAGTKDSRLSYKMEYTYTRAEILAFGENWGNITAEERAHRMERINIFTVLICTVLDVFKFKGNEETLRGWLGDTYDIISDILNITAAEIHYDPYDWFYFSDEITGSSNDATTGNWATFFPADGSEYLVSYSATTPYSLVYKYGYFDYYRHASGETGNLWNADSVGYLKDNFYYLIDTVIGLATDFDSAGAFIADAWGGLNLYSKKNLYSVGSMIGNLLKNFEGVLSLALNIVLGVDIKGHWDEYIYSEFTDDASLAGKTYEDENGNTITYVVDEIMKRTDFVNKLVDIFSPADFLVSWFLVGKDTPIEFFYTKTGEAAISLPGGNGYDEALVPILEALGCDLSDSDEFFASVEGGKKSGINVVKYLADKLLGRVDDIAASKNPVQEIVAMLPELIYFINANGLSVSVRNFLQPVVSLLGVVNNFVDTGDIGEIKSIDDLFAFAMDMLSDSLDVNFDLRELSIKDLSITGIFDIVKLITGIDINTAMTWPLMKLDSNGNYVPDYENDPVNIYKQLALGKVTRFTSGNGRVSFRMDAADDPAALSQIDMIAILMATVVNVFMLKTNEGIYANRQAFVTLLGDKGADIFDAIVNILNIEEAKYIDYDWLFTLRNKSNDTPYLDPAYENSYVSPIDKVSAITGTAGYDKYWTKDMAQYVADNLIPVVNNVLLLIGVSIPGIDGPIESIEDLINGLLPDGSLYTNSLLSQLTGLIAGKDEEDDGLIGKLDEIDPNRAIEGLLKNLLGIDLSKIRDYKGKTDFGFIDGDRDGFVNALAEFLSPVNPLLEWLFTDKSISLFYNADASDLIKLPGGNGYEQAIIPLFEAVIGYNNPNIKSLAEYKADVAKDPKNILVDILNPLLDFVDAALADPLNVILNRIPAIVYFINSKGADRLVKNLLGPVYQVLNALNTLVDIDIDEIIKGAIGFSLEELDFNAIIEVIIGLLPDNLSSLSPLIVDAVKEFTIGKVIKYPSKARFHTETGATYSYGFTMVLDEESENGSVVYGSTNATLADLITILLRAVLKWVTMPENQETVINFLSENIKNETTRSYILNLYGADPETLGSIDSGLIGFRYTPYGVSQMMALVYYLFFAVNFASDFAIGAVSQYGSFWPFIATILRDAALLDSSQLDELIPGLSSIDLSFLTSVVGFMDGLVERVTGSTSGGGTQPPVTEGNDTGGVNLNFFQRLLQWFKDLFAKIKSWFSK